MVLWERDARLKIAKTMQKMLGVRRVQPRSTSDLPYINAFIHFIGRNREVPLEVAT